MQDVATEMAFDQDTSYLFESFLVPSICLFPFNTAVSAELWSVLSAISSYPIRYSLYGSIRSSGLEKEALRKVGAVRKPLLQIESEVESGREVRYRLRRVSMENVREVGKQIAKVANTNPLVVFTAILNQIESYDNLISLMVDTFEFLTSYSLDVLGYCLLTFLGGGDAKLSRTKTKGAIYI
jgi:THO complex subunit 2